MRGREGMVEGEQAAVGQLASKNCSDAIFFMPCSNIQQLHAQFSPSPSPPCTFCADMWDCLACCFFIDTAHNVIEYLQAIHNVLKPGGYWINFGRQPRYVFHYVCMCVV